MAGVKKGKEPPIPLAKLADRHVCYEKAVQAPKNDAKFLSKAYKELFHRLPYSLREDFCGTAALCCAFVSEDPRRVAIGIDNDESVLKWAKEHNLAKAGSCASRIKLIEGDCLSFLPSRSEEHSEIICAFNYSIGYLADRRQLLQYFSNVYKALHGKGLKTEDKKSKDYRDNERGGNKGEVDLDVALGEKMNQSMLFGREHEHEQDQEEQEQEVFNLEGGIFVCDIFGGTSMFSVESKKKDCGEFTYIWNQEGYDWVSGRMTNSISFRFPDRSVMKRAFVYNWRIWTLPEIKSALEEVGFRKIVVWAAISSEEEGILEFNKVSRLDGDTKTWNAMIVAY